MSFKAMTSQCTVGDPKLWPSPIKYATLLNISLFIFMGNMYSAGITTGFPQLAMDFHVSFGQLTDLVAYSVLALGVSSLLWMPLALCIGKRPVIIASLTVFFAGSLWSQYATNFDSLLASRVFASIGAGSVETIGPAMVADMFHERHYATAMGIITVSLAAGSQIGPLIAGYLIQARGWQWFFKLTSILIGINLFFTLFLLPETTFRRKVTDGQSATEPRTQVVSNKTEDVEAVEIAPDPSLPESVEYDNAPYAGSYMKDLVQFRNRGLEKSGIRKLFRRGVEPFQFFAVPQVVYAGVSFGVIIGGIVLISALAPSLLAPPPYLFDSISLGLFAMASLIGVVVAFPMAGPLTDMLSQFMRKRAGGEHKPEHRVPALIVPFLICPPGLILFAYTIAEHKSYVIAGVGYAMQSAGLVLVPSVVLAYTVDAYPRRGGEALVLINAIKNSVAFGLTKGVNTWFTKEGLKMMFVELAAVQWAVLFLAMPLYFVSPWLRRKTLRFL